ncbi:MAG: preprotein translocase subunit SecG [Chloroflexi bacterium]|nr:preprotein translocase subunit SecG [Chloroflexota bacterium]MCH8223726.1 preprotein translocase subunit SecG [Chloroflexota bacterium]
METLVNWIEIILAVMIIGVVLLQVRGTGAQLFGAAESSFRVRRGFERTLFRGTVVLAMIFTVIAVIAVRLSN